MASQKTLPTDQSAEAFLAGVADDARRDDAIALAALLTEWTGEPAVMWGSSIVGFGRYEYRYASGHEGTAPVVGFSPRKANLVLYLAAGLDQSLLEQLGPHKLGKGCLYLKRLRDADHAALRALVERTVHAHHDASAD